MIRLSKKFIRRAITGLALLAPVVYLFGSQFFALNGAHGEEVLAETVETTPSYDELMQVENFNYGAFDWTNEHGTRLGFSLGYLYYYLGANDSYIALCEYGVFSNPLNDNSINYGLGFSGSGDISSYYFAFFLSSVLQFDETANADDKPLYSCFYAVPDGSTGFQSVLAFTFDYVGAGSTICRLFECPRGEYGYNWELVSEDGQTEFSLDDRSSWNFYFDDGANLPEGVTWNDELRSYFVPSVKPVQTSNYKTSLFSSMFGESNFLTSWGEDAISDNPHGFAPFGNMLQFVDENMLHLSDLQIGLMGYGYFYYCAHVLLFVCFFDLTTFFLSCILRITHKFGGADYED